MMLTEPLEEAWSVHKVTGKTYYELEFQFIISFNGSKALDVNQSIVDPVRVVEKAL